MNIVYLVLGAVLLVAAVVDIVWTTLWVDGGDGPLSSRLAEWVWRGLQTVDQGKSGLLSIAGPLILTLTVAMWVVLLWFGWTFLFAGGQKALVSTRHGPPVTWEGRLWYVAYTMFTVGNGDFSPNGGLWQIASALTTISGFIFVTMGITYVLSVMSAVSNKRAFARRVTTLGSRSEELVRAGWNGEDFSDLDTTLDELGTELIHLADQHRSYPILHYYHTEREMDASSMAVAIFDEALTVLEHGVPEERRPNPVHLKEARSGTEAYVQALDISSIAPTDRTPPGPELDRLQAAGIPTVSDDQFEDALAARNERREKLLWIVEDDAWYWPLPRSE